MEYTYDNAGNIMSKKVYKKESGNTGWTLDNEYEYVYNSVYKDQLLKIVKKTNENNCLCTSEESFSYDNIGNPTIYKKYLMSWGNVNRLTGYRGNTFSYDASGMRLSKNDIQYTYDGDRLLKETRNGKTIYYYHGVDGIAAIIYNANKYTYVKNMLGDVIGLKNASGNIVAKYRYDAFGNHKVYDGSGDERTDASFIGNINPIR